MPHDKREVHIAGAGIFGVWQALTLARAGQARGLTLFGSPVDETLGYSGLRLRAAAHECGIECRRVFTNPFDIEHGCTMC